MPSQKNATIAIITVINQRQNRMSRFRWWLCATVLCISSIVWAQDTCPVIVKTALDATSDACASTARNQACYGNIDISATLREGSTAQFAQVGDIVQILEVETITLKPLDEVTNTWGVALLRVQANLPDTLPGQNVTMVLFGDVSLTNVAPEAESPQAFYFSTGIGDSPCAEAPASGVLVQSPQGAGTISLTLNGVEVTMGSTLYFNGAPNEDMTIAVLEGEATLTQNDESVTLTAGLQTSVALDSDGNATGAFSDPAPYETESYSTLPVILLPETIGASAETTPEAPTSVAVTADDINGTWEVAYRDGNQSDSCPMNMLAGMSESISSQPIEFTATPDGTSFTINVFVETGISQRLTFQSDGVYYMDSTPMADEGVSVRSMVVFLSKTTFDFYYEVTIDPTLFECTVHVYIDGTKSE
jgi:hypothetical protein